MSTQNDFSQTPAPDELTDTVEPAESVTSSPTVSAFSPEATGETPVSPAPSFAETNADVPPVGSEAPLAGTDTSFPSGTYDSASYSADSVAGSKGINFGLLAWAFIVFAIGVFIIVLPFTNGIDPVVLAIVSSGAIGLVLLVFAFVTALKERKRR
ncbi:hypothetical protein NXS08_06840 [Gleimia sp. 6138-11-ORH1]|uniref:hypothetical protein n=1 Tax=Gleimia sp. 6138-11-ORH1 TaxID=2973937 RepID=UPI0021682466|nr:hypothetical protein [Gleimia sp. 6138-11-ORH1]MCS4485180.1 hypothetical protein [Gleimia sp. 6138-11-ORH1]